MPINPLPAETCRAISSSLVLSDATSVVKELIDNALDANASSVFIEISSNTLDIIQVRDNGTGIHIEDRQLLCKRGCTSKVRTMRDIFVLGGAFLGFRGSALASLTQLGGPVTIMTRIDGELVGSALKFGPEGNLLSSTPVAHPTGTTVRIQDFLSRLPVRKELASRSVSKTLGALKKLLYSYVLARPQTRFSLKVLKNKDGKMNYSFSPCPITASLSEVATKAFGRDLSLLCKELTGGKAFDECPAQRFKLQMLLLDPSCDLSTCPGGEQYFSVDGRPLSAEKGLMKEMSKLYKKYLSHLCDRLGAKSFPSRPFLYVKLTCPPESYDVNIEPAKDEVRFLRPDSIMSEFEELLAQVYGKLGPDRNAVKPPTAKTSSQRDSTSFDLYMTQNHTKGEEGGQNADSHNSISTIPNLSQAAGLPSPRHELFNNHVANREDPGERLSKVQSNRPALADVTNTSSNNPWTMAKMNVKLLPKLLGSNQPAESIAGVENESAHHVFEQRELNPPNGWLPSPVTTPIRPHGFSADSVPNSDSMRPWALRQKESDHATMLSSGVPVIQNSSPPTTWPGQQQYGSQTSPSEQYQAWKIGKDPLPSKMGRGHGKFSGAGQQERCTRLHKPFKSPTKTQTGRAGSGPPPIFGGMSDLESTLSSQSTMLLDRSVSTSNRRGSEILGFERQEIPAGAEPRKTTVPSRECSPIRVSTYPFQSAVSIMKQDQASVVEHMETLGDQGYSDKMSNKGTPRLLKDNLHETSSPETHDNKAYVKRVDQQQLVIRFGEDYTQVKIPESDPRGYLIHHIRASSTQEEPDMDFTQRSRLMIESTRRIPLPLELIPEDLETCQFITVLDGLPDMEQLRYQATKMTMVDEYATTGKVNACLHQLINEVEV